jgi:hypothetical protein
MSNLGTTLHKQAVTAYEQTNTTAFSASTKTFLALLSDLDTLMGTQV